MTARIAPAQPPYAPGVAEDFARLMPEGIAPIGLFRTLAHNPRVLRRVQRGGLLDPGSISLRQRELVILRTTARAGAEYEWGVHAAFFGRAAGFDAAQLHATAWLGDGASCWDEDEAALVRACDELHETARISDATWARLRPRFTDEQMIEVVILAGLYRAISCAVNTARISREAGAPRFPPPISAGPAIHRGSCLCRNIRYELTAELGEFGYCHCTSCRKASGSAHAANAPIERASFHLVHGADTLREYESSPGKLRAFCTHCGSPIYAFLAASPGVLRVRLGSLDTTFTRQPRAHTFVSDKAAWEPIDDTLPRFPEWAPKTSLDQRGSRQP